METLLRDLRVATRSLARNPAFALTAMVTIALGIGASTAIFSVVNAVLLRPLPYVDAARLVHVWPDLRNRKVVDFAHPPGDLYDLRQQATLFEGFAAINLTGRQPIGGDGVEPELIPVAGVTPNFFRLIGARIIHGRDFTEADGARPPQPAQQPPVPATQPGKAPASAQPAASAANVQGPPRVPTMVILSHGFWQRRFGGDTRIVGQKIEDGRLEVVGILSPGLELLFPPGVNMESKPDMWTAMRLDFEGASRINVFLRIIGRVKPGISLERAQSEVDAIAAELRRRFAVKESAGLHFRLEPMHKDLVADVRPALVALMGAVMFVLLIACANVANLLLVRASARERELAVRAAVGATRGRLLRQMLAESFVLAGGGALLGLVLGQWGIELLLLLKPANLPRIDSVRIDPAVLAFNALTALLAAMAFGLLPARRASRANLTEVLRQSGQGAALGGGRLLRNSVVVAEVALSFVLLIGAGLMIRSFLALQQAYPGYDPQNLLTFGLANLRLKGPEEAQAFSRQLHDRLAALPGAQSVSAASVLPLDGTTPSVRWGTETALADPNAFQQATFYIVQPGYFEAMRTPLIEGRTFTPSDILPNSRIAVVDQRLAAKAFPNQSAVGQRILARPGAENPDWYEIIGVVAHQRHTRLSADGRETIYMAEVPGFGHAARWIVRTTGDPTLLATAVRAEVKAMNPLVIITELQPMTDYVDRAQGQTRFALVLIGVFAAIAAVLAAVGLYGVLSTVVRQRTAEIGVRMAFGAQPAGILRMMLAHGLRLSALGIGIGLLAALGLTRVMETLLVGVTPTDPITFAAIVVLFVAIAAAASWVPARRAATLDPMVALRQE